MRNNQRLPKFIVPLIAILALLPTRAYALDYDFEVDGIYYKQISSSEVEVTTINDLYSNYEGPYSGDVKIPETVKNGDTTYSVSSIGDYAFSICRSLTSIEIPATVTSIGRSAFAYCVSLSSIDMSTSVALIGESAFYNCILLTSIELPASVTSIENSAFSGCRSLTSIEIPSSVTTIGSEAFFNCSSLTSIEIPASVMSIGNSAFAGCSSLTSIEIPAPVTSIENGTFYGCSALTSIEIPVSVTSIGSSAFHECSSLTSIELPASVTSIGEWAFNGCSSLKSIEIPSSVTSIVDWTFSGCSSLTSIELPFSIISIGYGAFYDCSSLTRIEIPSSVTSIGREAFANCRSLTSIDIPASVTSIGYLALDGCSSLDKVICLSESPASLDSNPFQISSAKLMVPESALDAYKLSDWSKYFVFIEAIQIAELNVETSGSGKIYTNGLPIANTTPLDEDGNVTLFVIPDDGNRVASAYLDGEDVADKIVNHILEIKGHKETGTLKVVFAPESEASLTIKGAESHSLTHYYKEGSQTRIDLKPEDGWKLYSISFNGEDVTDAVLDGSYITPALTGDNNLEVVMNSDNTSEVDKVEVAQRKISFRKAGNTIEILNLEEGETISIYNAEGRCEYQGNHHVVSLDSNNVYILRTRRETLKFSL